MTWRYSNTVVFGPAAGPTVETALPLGSIVGTEERLVRIKAKCITGGDYAAFKPGAGSGADPHPESWAEFARCAMGCTEARVINAGEVAVVECPTDDLGCLRWITQGGTSWTLTLEIWSDDPIAWATVFGPGAAPGAYTDVDLGGSGLAWCKLRRVTVSAYDHHYVRSDGEADQFLYGPSLGGAATAGHAHGFAALAVGDLIEHRSYTLDQYQIDVAHIDAGWVDTTAHAANPIWPLNAMPVARTALDLSPIVGAQRVVAWIRVEGNGPDGATYEPGAFMPTGDSDTYAVGTGNFYGGEPDQVGTNGLRLYIGAAGWGAYQKILTNAAGSVDWISGAGKQAEVRVLGYAPVGSPPPPPPAASVIGYQAAIARGCGTLDYWVRVAGLPVVLTTAAADPSEPWFSGLTRHRGLRAEGLTLACRCRPGEVWPDLGTMAVSVDDDGTLQYLLRDPEAGPRVQLSASLLAGITSAQVEDNTELPSPPYAAWVDQETVAVSDHPDPTHLTLSRGEFGTTDTDHRVDDDVVPPYAPEVQVSPGDLRQRRCWLYVSETRGGEQSALSCVWIGYVSGAHAWKGRRLTFPVSHVLEGFKAGAAFAEIPTGRVTGLVVANLDGSHRGRLYSREPIAGDITIDVVAAGTATHFDDSAELIRAVQDALIAAAAPWELTQDAAGFCIISYTGAENLSSLAAAPIASSPNLLQLLGFEVDRLLVTSAGDAFLAIEPPAEVFAYLQDEGSYAPSISLRPGEAGRFVESYCRVETGADQYFLCRVLAVSGVGNRLDTQMVGWFDRDNPGVPPGAFWGVLVRAGETPPVVRQVWGWQGTPVEVAFRLLWSGIGYSADPVLPYTAPVSWRPMGATADGDVDWDGLRSALRATCPAELRTLDLFLTEPSEVAELLTGMLLIAGVYLGVGADGIVTAHRCAMLAPGEAETPITDAVVDGQRVRDATTELSSERLVNAMRVVLAHGEAKWSLYPYDGASLQRYGGRLARDTTDPLAVLGERGQEIELPVAAHTIRDPGDLEERARQHLAQTTFALLSRPRPVAHLPVVMGARAHNVGDAVLATSRWIYDHAAGVQGVAARPATVLGWSRDMAWGGRDTLDLMLFGDLGGCIAPCALATAWAAGSLTLTIADDDLYHRVSDASDLSYLEAGDVLRIQEYGAETPTVWAATIAAVDPVARTVELLADPFGGAFPASGAWLTLADYDTASSDSRSEGWLWAGDDADGLILDLDPAVRVTT